MVHAVLAGDVDVVGERLQPADLKGDHHVVGVVERCPLVVGHVEPCRESVVVHKLARIPCSALCPLDVYIHKREGGIPEGGEAQKVTEQAQREDIAARPDHRDLRH